LWKTNTNTNTNTYTHTYTNTKQVHKTNVKCKLHCNSTAGLRQVHALVHVQKERVHASVREVVRGRHRKTNRQMADTKTDRQVDR